MFVSYNIYIIFEQYRNWSTYSDDNTIITPREYMEE